MMVEGTNLNRTCDFYIDADNDSSTGYAYWYWNECGADYLVQNGILYAFSGTTQGSWAWSEIGNVDIEKNELATEVSIELSQIGLSHPNNIKISYCVDNDDCAPAKGNKMLTLLANNLGDSSPPTAPINLVATQINCTSVKLIWDASTDNIAVTSYEIYRDGVSVGTTDNTSYTDMGLESNTTYTYTVKAYDAVGNVSEASDELSVTTMADTQAPTVPQGVTATAISSASVNVSWTASTDNVAVTGYEVYRDGTKIVTAVGTSYADAGLSANTSYTYTIKAVDKAGNLSEASIEATVTTIPPINIVQIANGREFTLMLGADGIVWSLGDNSEGQLGDGTDTLRTTPIQVQGLSDVTAIAAGGWHSLALKNDGTVWSWGRNNYGQLGDGSTTNTSTPTQVSGITNAIAISVGRYHSLALMDDGTVWSWGYNSRGQLGDGTTTKRKSPVQVSALNGVTAIAAGYYHSLAIKDDNTLWAWGNNSKGELGEGTTNNSSTPIQVQNFNDIAEINAGHYYSLAVKTDGTVYAWGDNQYCELGDGIRSLTYTQPVKFEYAKGNGNQDTEAPTTPSDIVATPTCDTVTLSWTASTDNIAVIGYEIYRDGVSIGTTEHTTYTDIALSNDTTYTYAIKAYDEQGNKSELTSGIDVKTTNEIMEIIVDGDASEWTYIPPLCSGEGNVTSLSAFENDIKLFMLAQGTNLNTSSSFYIDSDNSSATGYKAGYWSDCGADYLIDGDSLYKYTGTDGEAEWSWSKLGPVNIIKTDTVIELSINLNRISITTPNDMKLAFRSGYSGSVPEIGGNMTTVEYIDVTVDTDEDMLPDRFEILAGTNPYNIDTDGDGLTDYMELAILATDPLKVDTDDNGIEDGDEDSDEDRLSNQLEIDLGTNPIKNDTDEDGLLDGEEVHDYQTDPLKQDTDEDNASDKWELDNGYNPCIYNDSFDAETEIQINDKISNVSLQINDVDGYAAETLSIAPITNVLFNDEIPGYIGDCCEFTTDGSFESATVSYTLDASLFDDVNFVPTLYYFNEETQLLEEVENQEINGNVVSATLAHFSKYILINKSVYESSWDYTLLYDENGTNEYKGMDIVFAIDSSGSMAWNDSNNVRKTVTKNFVDILTENDRAAIVDFDGYARIYSGFTSDSAALYSAIDKIDSDGSTNLSIAMSASIGLFTSSAYEGNGRTKYIVMLTDGEKTYSSTYTTIAKNNNIVVYTVGLGSEVSTSVLTGIANGTGGEYYHVNNADKLYGVFDNIAKQTDLYKDSDSDGLNDYYEKEMNNGNLTLGTGVKLTGLNYLQADTDNDSLIDSQEILVEKNGNKVFVRMISNPTTNDTDGDGLLDGAARMIHEKKVAPKDPEPLYANGPVGIWQAQYEQELEGDIPDKLTWFYPYKTSEVDIDYLIQKAKEKLPSIELTKEDLEGLEIQEVLEALQLELSELELSELIDFSDDNGHWPTNITAFGSHFLWFRYDNDKEALHSQPVTWQKLGGYNDTYDYIFSEATDDNVRFEKFPFNDTDGKEYMLWTWRGDYLNLGSGAETGIYTNPRIIPGTDIEHWDAIDSNLYLPMTLNLYNYYSKDNIDNIFCWAPDKDQWWITGFNPAFQNPDVTKMVSVGTVDFTGHEDMYDSLKEKTEEDDILKDFMIFDEEEHKVWMIWWEV